MTTTKFKNTEIGRIPEDWEVKELGKSALIKARIGWQGLTTQEYLDTGEYYLVTGTDFKDGKINWSGCHFVTKARYDQDKFIQIKKQDVLVSKDGTIGKVAYLDEIPGRGTLNSGVFVIRSKDSKITQPFLAIVFLSKYFDNFIDKILAGSTIVHLYQKDIVNFTFPLPPSKAEQSRIASALFDIDTLIRDLDRIIEKKKNIRQGAMEQLLSGKKRLPGFKGEWIDINLGQFGRMVRGVSFKPEQSHNIRSNNSSILLRSTNVQDGRIFMGEVIYVDNNCIRSEQIMKQGDILICTANGSRALVGKSALFLEKKKCTFGAFMSVFRCDEVQFSSFIYYLFQSSTYRRMLEDILSGSAINNLNASQVEELVFNIPANSDELFAIADTLTAMDDEIAVLQMERDKYANIRSGMMDDLLTGRKRL